MKTLLLLALLSGGFAVRYLRWLAFLQQKEYRLDRVRLFLQSSEGKKELLRFLPRISDFSRAGCKRPKFTKRMMVVLSSTLACMFLCFLALLLLFTAPLSGLFLPVLVLVILLYLAAPVIILLASAPTSLIADVIVKKTACSAQKALEKHSPVVIGITGSYGKSSTKGLLQHMLLQERTVFATPKSYNTLFSISQSVLKGYKDQEIAIIEYAAYMPGEIARIARFIRPQIGLITGFAPQHLGLFGTAENICTAKAELVAALAVGSPVYSNDSDVGTRKIVALGSQNNQAEHHPVRWQDLFSDVKLTPEGRLTFKRNGTKIQTQIIGMQYIENIALAWSVSEQFLKEEQRISALESFQPTPAYIRTYRHASGRLIIDDGGSSNPRGFEEALTLLESMTGTQKIVITPGIVDLGSQSDQIHTTLATRMKAVADMVWYVGESGREVSIEVLGKKVITDQDAILSLLRTKNQNGIVLVEGRMPAWIQKSLE